MTDPKAQPPIPKANSNWSQVVKWALIAVFVGALIFYILGKVLPANKKPEIFRKAKDKAKKVMDASAKKLVEHEAKMAANRKKLEDIKAIDDEEERLKALAEFGDKRR